MSEEQRPSMHSEDIDLDESGADSVVGGASSHHGMTVEQAEHAGYQAIACGPDGVTLMRNRKGHELSIPPSKLS